MNILSPSTPKSPLVKDYGITASIEAGRDKILAGYEKWKVASINGSQYITQIHNIKDKSRRSSDTFYPSELEIYCKKLEVVKKAFEEVIGSVATFRAQIKSSINILETMKDEQLKGHLKDIQKFLDILINAYDRNFKSKSFVIENIAHTKSLEESHLMVAAWSCDSTLDVIKKLVLQLKISPQGHRWSC